LAKVKKKKNEKKTVKLKNKFLGAQKHFQTQKKNVNYLKKCGLPI
jgi:hypothetical protein